MIIKKRQRSNEHQNVNLRENEAYGISLPMKVNAYGCNSDNEQLTQMLELESNGGNLLKSAVK